MYFTKSPVVPQSYTPPESKAYIHTDYQTEREMFSGDWDDLGFPGWDTIKRVVTRPVKKVGRTFKKAGSAIKRVSVKAAKGACQGVRSQAAQAAQQTASQVPNPYAQYGATGQQVASMLCSVGFPEAGSRTDAALDAIAKLTGMTPDGAVDPTVMVPTVEVPFYKQSWFIPAAAGGVGVTALLIYLAARR